MNFRLLMALGGTSLILFSGCQSTAPRPVAEDDASLAVGAAEPIIFRRAPGVLDATDVLPDTLSVTEAVRLTLKQHAGIQASLARVRAAEADADQAALLPNPILTVVAHFPQNGVAAEVEVGLSADLIAIVQRPGRISAADSRLRAAASEAVSAVLDAVAEVRETYYAVQSLQASLPLLEARRDLLARLQDLARSRLEAGEGSRLETVTLDAQRVEIEAELDDLLLELTEQRLALARLVGQPSTDALLRVSEWQPPAVNSVRDSAWVSAALKGRPELKARRWELLALGADARLNTLSPFSGTFIGADVEKQGDWAGGPAVSVPIPLFDWGQARRARIKARRIEAAHNLVQTQREIVEQVRRAAAVFNESVHELARVRTKLIPLQEQRRELAEEGFRAGQTDVTTVILAEQDLAAAKARAVALERKNAVALLRLERAVGGAGVAEALVKSVPAATSQRVVPVTSPTTAPTNQTP